MVDQINHRDLAQSRLATQFREASNLINYIRSLLKENDDLEQVFQDLLIGRFIDAAEGVQLDILGDIVGQDRTFKKSVNEVFFGFLGGVGIDTFGTSGDSLIGANLKSVSDEEFIDAIFDDATYRKFIRAKVLKNKTKVVINEIIEIMLQGVSSATGLVVSESQASFTLTFIGSLSDDDKLLLTTSDFTPRPAGVGVSYADDDGTFA